MSRIMSQMVNDATSGTVESCSLSDKSRRGSEVLNNGVGPEGDTHRDDKKLQLRSENLPKRLRERLNNCPTPGNGVHSWLFGTAWRLHEWVSKGEIVEFSEDQIIELLTEKLSCTRPEREIREAVINAGRYFRGETPLVSQSFWPAVDYALIHKTVVDCPVRLKDLRGLSPVGVSDKEPMTEEILDALYPGNPLLCLAWTVQSSWTRPREFWRGKASRYPFIVPNPMTKERGTKLGGGQSERCLDNTGPRKYLPIEFDISVEEPWAPYVAEWKRKGITVDDANVALHWALATAGVPRFPWLLAVHSGNKSVHVWYPCEGYAEEQIKPFMHRAVRLGADKATWTRCQLVRMLDGMRDNATRQSVHYFNPGILGTQKEAE